MSIIAEPNNCSYWEMRAAEQLREIQHLPLSDEEIHDRLELVMRLISLSLAKRNKDGQNQKKGSN